MKLQNLTNNKFFNVIMPIIFTINSYLLYNIYYDGIYLKIQSILLILVIMFLLFQVLFWIILTYIQNWIFNLSNYILTNGIYIGKILEELKINKKDDEK